MKNNNKNIIEIKNLNKWYGNFHALKNINLNVKKGEIIVICGPSGSGKSTVIKSILRILPAPGVITKGEIKYNNQDILEFLK